MSQWPPPWPSGEFVSISLTEDYYIEYAGTEEHRGPDLMCLGRLGEGGHRESERARISERIGTYSHRGPHGAGQRDGRLLEA